MTSNLGSQEIQSFTQDSDYEEMKKAVMAVVGQQFRPEFINRIDDVVVFHALDRSQIREIAGIQLRNLRQRLGERDMQLEISDQALDRLGEAGFDPVYGARPLKRAIQQRVENPLAERILAGEFGPDDTIYVDVDGDDFVFSREEARPAQAAVH
jgi:ATP-dependent Clp protease ATP-binding subunit ClpB